MTLRDKILAELRELKDSGDPEYAHSRADQLLCDRLTATGCGDIAKAWDDVPGWYT